METTSSFGYWIRRQRKALDLTQQALADRVGCSLAAIKKIEGDERRPSRQIAERMADILGVPANQRENFIEVARGVRPVDQLILAHELASPIPTRTEASKTFPHNLPVQLTSFIGREWELSQGKQWLAITHLLTLTGPGGTGKTRLALQLATEVSQEYLDGVWHVELAPLTDPALVPQTIAFALGVREQPGRTIFDSLGDYLRAKRLLLILDNCEHLIEIWAQLSDHLLRTAPGLKILATSRESLGISGEMTYRVPSLELPDPRQPSDLDELAQNDCVHLFVDRASAALPHFHLSPKNASAVIQICRRLDGIPLAIELAAARTKVFPPEQIAARLDDRFRLLTGGSRTALERHQTLQALIDWSYELLSEAERQLLGRLSVFSGGWSIEAVQAVCADESGDEGLDTLAHLVDKSLVIVEEEAEEGRYRLLETIRQYGRNKLLESGEVAMVRDRHLEYYLRFVELAEPKLRGAEQLEWLDRVEGEHGNLRAALAWSLESEKPNLALRLTGALHYFWELRGYFSEGQKWLDDALAHSGHEQKMIDMEVVYRAKALYGAGRMRSLMLSDWDIAFGLIDESLRLYRLLGDKWWMAVVLDSIGYMLIFAGDFETARSKIGGRRETRT